MSSHHAPQFCYWLILCPEDFLSQWLQAFHPGRSQQQAQDSKISLMQPSMQYHLTIQTALRHLGKCLGSDMEEKLILCTRNSRTFKKQSKQREWGRLWALIPQQGVAWAGHTMETRQLLNELCWESDRAMDHLPFLPKYFRKPVRKTLPTTLVYILLLL